MCNTIFQIWFYNEAKKILGKQENVLLIMNHQSAGEYCVIILCCQDGFCQI